MDTVHSDSKDEIDKLMKDSDKEFIAPKYIKLTDNADNAKFLIPEGNIHAVDEGTIHTKELETNKIRKKLVENNRITWKCNVFPHS